VEPVLALLPGSACNGTIAENKNFTTAACRAASQGEARDGAEPVGGTPEEFAAHIRAETAKWAKVVKPAGIPPE